MRQMGNSYKDMEKENLYGYEKIERYNPETLEELAGHYKEILRLLGEDTKREGLLATPMRVAKAMQFFTHGYDLDPEAILRSAMFKEDYKQMVLVKDIEIYSLCEHHMALFHPLVTAPAFLFWFSLCLSRKSKSVR